MTTDLPRLLTRRRFIGGATAATALVAMPAVAQEQPPVIEPIEPEGEPISPDDGDPAEIEQMAADEAGEYVAETGHNIAEPFLAVWRQAGGRDVLGLPLSEERFDSERGAVEQYFEGVILVNAPDDVGNWYTQGRDLGESRVAELADREAQQPVAGCGAGDASCQYFPETGHTMSGDIAAVWNQGGGAPIFGLPLTEPFPHESGIRQVFGRVVLDSDNAGNVTAAPVGRDIATELGLENNPAFLPAPPTFGTSTLVTASDGLRLRRGPSTDADIVAVLDDNAEFIAVTGATGPWIPGYADGYSGYVAAEFLTSPEDLPEVAFGGQWDPSIWQGAALAETNIRTGPGTSHRIVTTIQYGDPVTVADWVKGEKVDGGSDTWAQLGDGTFLYERNVGRAGPVEPTPVPDDAPWEGRWIDCNLTQQLLIAYEGRTPVRVTVQTTGKPGWETPTGFYYINNRVANETMESGSIGAEEFYRLENVLYTQYFTDRGHALHFAWWKTPETIGRPGSHGCLNLLLDDAEFFWNWADYGVPVYCHY